MIVYKVGEEGEDAEPVLKQQVPGTASSWTPPLESCLERGGHYAWSVRALRGKITSVWSSPSLFEVAAGPSEKEFEAALEIVQRYLSRERSGSGGGPSSRSDQSLEATSATPQTTATSASGATRPAVAGDSSLQVNGSSVVTVATLAGALCSTTELRFLDQGDGTVLDCNTGNIWLKDTCCFGELPYDDGVNPNIFTKLAELNAGLDLGCNDYQPGTHSDWQIPDIADYCSAGAVVQTCPAANAGDSLVDSTLDPALPNAAGDGPVALDDAFAPLPITSNLVDTWSANSVFGTSAWYVAFKGGNVNFQGQQLIGCVVPVRKP